MSGRDTAAYLLVPLLARRELIAMPCRHAHTFVWAEQRRRGFFEEIGEDYPGDDETLADHPSYCDCAPFDRHATLMEIGDLCLKQGLQPDHLSSLAEWLVAITTTTFAYNWVQRAMLDFIRLNHWQDLRYARKIRRKHGNKFVSVCVLTPGDVAPWQ